MSLKDIRTKKDYEEYKMRVDGFFEKEGIQNLSSIMWTDDYGDSHDPEPYFSWRPCECCQRNLGGDRYDCNGYNPTTKEVQGEYSICIDCYYFAEYGQLDDTTMELIEHVKEEDREDSQK